MEFWYALVSLLPFQWAHYTFMQNALLAIILVSPVFGVTGTMVVNNRMSFFSDAMGHAALTGLAIGVVLGMGEPLWAMLIFAAVLAVAIALVHIKSEASMDTVIGVFFSAAVALGVVILSRGGSFSKYTRYLVGDLLSISPGEIRLLALVLVMLLVFWTLFFNWLFLSGFSLSIARSRGVNISLVEILFTVFLALVVTLSIQWVGLLIINSLLILPAAAARNITGNMRAYHLVSVVISLSSGLAGLIISYHWNTATGATVVLCAFLVFLLTLAWKGINANRSSPS